MARAPHQGPLGFAPVLDNQLDPGSLDSLKIFGIPCHQWKTEPKRRRRDQAIRQLENGALFSRSGSDDRGFLVVVRSWRNLLVLVQPDQRLFQLARCALELQAKHDLMDGNAGKGEGSVLTGIAGGVTSNNFVMSLQVFGEDVCIQENLGNLESGRRAAGTASFLISELDHFVQQRGIFRAAK